MGPSGSGKSTLLHVLAGLDRPTSGEVFLGDTEITSLNDKALTLLRRDRIGFIFQSFNLLPTLTAAREHRAADAHRRPQARRRPGSTRSSTPSGSTDRLEPSAGPAVRRPAAARRRGPGAGQPAADRLRRRADRCARLALRRRAARLPAQRRRELDLPLPVLGSASVETSALPVPLLEPAETELSSPITTVAFGNLGKCETCGFPVSEGRKLCLDCEAASPQALSNGLNVPGVFRRRVPQLGAISSSCLIGTAVIAVATIALLIWTALEETRIAAHRPKSIPEQKQSKLRIFPSRSL